MTETEALAAAIGNSMRGGEVVLLTGELGSGKTVFVRGLARGLGVDAEVVTSPTFVLLTSHAGRLTLYHADLYRLRGNGDEQELGLEELPGPTVCWRWSGQSGCRFCPGRAACESRSITRAAMRGA